MLRRTLIVSFLMSAPLMFGQLDSNSITVSASRSTALQADQAVFTVDVQAALNTGLDDVLGALAGSGITLVNFNGVNGGSQLTSLTNPLLTTIPFMAPGPTLDWSFTLPVAISQIKATAASLTSLQQNIAQKNGGLTLSFRVSGTQVSPQLQQSQTCSVADLVSDARAKAQKLANAAGVTLGNILAMSTSISSSTSCSLTVKFQLVRLS
jgi:uncharacterized protein YggE